MGLDRSGPNEIKHFCNSRFRQTIGSSFIGLIEGQLLQLDKRLHWLAGGRVCCFLLALFSLILLTIGLGSYPLNTFDEARLAVSAMEMHLRGPSLVTTYEFAPDHWSVKPPLAIWLMTFAMNILGPTEFALRLPSAIAAATTIGLTAHFCWLATRSVAWSLFAAALLLGAPVFSGVHAASTGDYDAPLTLFTTSYLYLLFFLVHRKKPKFTKLLLAGLCVSAAVLTKSVAGVIPGVAVVVYLVLVSRGRRVLTARYVSAGLFGAVPVVAYYFYREQVDPGYLSLVNQSELLGRYASPLEGHEHPIYWYLAYLLPPSFTGGVLIPALPFAWRRAAGRNRLALIYSTVVAFTVVIVYSMGATKIGWYLMPAMPWLAVSVTLGGRTVFQELRSADLQWQRIARYALLLIAVTSVAIGSASRARRYMLTRTQPADMYSSLMNALYDRGERSIHILDGGAAYTDPSEEYNPQLRFYALYWGQGLNVHRLSYARYWGEHGANAHLLSEVDADGTGDIVATCDPNMRARISGVAGATLVLDDGTCVAIKVKSES